MLPNGDKAVVELEKLTEYCLNPEHPRGRHKARVFAASLGINVEQAETLREALIVAACTMPAVATDLDDFGQR